MDDNPLLLFKCQGEDQAESMDNLGKDDFLLVLQIKFQIKAMKKYGKNVILMVATHCTTQYNFLLISNLVVDDYGEGLHVELAIRKMSLS